MKISDKAERASGPDVVLAKNTVGVFELASDELIGADDITPEGEYPQYGDFVEAGRVKQSGEVSDVWLQVPADLSVWLTENEIAVGDRFRIGSARKVDGAWEYTCYADV